MLYNSLYKVAHHISEMVLISGRFIYITVFAILLLSVKVQGAAS
jgi:hypothetical protein